MTTRALSPLYRLAVLALLFPPLAASANPRVIYSCEDEAGTILVGMATDSEGDEGSIQFKIAGKDVEAQLAQFKNFDDELFALFYLRSPGENAAAGYLLSAKVPAGSAAFPGTIERFTEEFLPGVKKFEPALSVKCSAY